MSDEGPIQASGLSGAWSVVLSLDIYTLPAVLRATHWLTKTWYAHLQWEEREHSVRVFVFPKPGEPGSATVGVGELTNTALDFTLRDALAAKTEAVRNLVMAHALSKTNFINQEFDEAPAGTDPHNVSRPDDAVNH